VSAVKTSEITIPIGNEVLSVIARVAHDLDLDGPEELLAVLIEDFTLAEAEPEGPVANALAEWLELHL
jgi:hypothetical protein